MLGGYSGMPQRLRTALFEHDNRVLLIPSASFEWGTVERRLRATMAVVPARVEHLEALAAEGRSRGPSRSEADEIGMIPPACFEETEANSGGDPPSLATFLDGDVSEWL
jgi:hypothetical protein